MTPSDTLFLETTTTIQKEATQYAALYLQEYEMLIGSSAPSWTSRYGTYRAK